MKRRQLDELWKGILENTFEDFLRFINPDVDTVLDLQRGIVFLDKELDLAFGNNKPSPKIVDKLARVYTIDGKEEYILVHVEVQDQYREDFSRRMFEYYYRIFDQYHKPITAYAIFLEDNVIERPDYFEQNCLGTSLHYKYNTYKIANQSYDELIEDNNPFALAVLTAKSALMLGNIKDEDERDRRLFGYKRKLLRLLVSRKMPRKKIEALLYFLRFYIVFENNDFNTKFDNEVKSLTNSNNISMGIEEQLLEIWKRDATELGLQEGLEKGLQQGLEKGLQEGLEKGQVIGQVIGQEIGLRKAKEKEILNLISKLGFSNEQAADFAEVTVSYVEELLAQH